MASKQHIIELNGKRYDAVTGKMIAISPSSAKAALSAVKHAAIDGFTRSMKPRINAGNHVPPHKAEKSKTLMRTAVKKPDFTPSARVPKSIPRAKPSASAIAAHTPIKPRAVHKSALIRRFSDMMPSSMAPALAPEKAPQTTRLQAIATATAATTNPLAAGLANADSHNQPKAKRARSHSRLAKRLRISPRALSAGSLVLAGLLVGGFFAYQNIPNLSMRLASARAGLHGTLPSYQPAGFGLKDGITYKPGQIEISYKSNSDDRNFKITQNTSSWNSETLLENYDALKNGTPPLAVPTKGKTVYIYNGGNATWVDGGVWYRIEGDSKLNSDQLLNVANSM